MERNSTPDFKTLLQKYSKDGVIPQRLRDIMHQFYSSYKEALTGGDKSMRDFELLFVTFLELIKEQCLSPFSFQPYHQQVREPFDYYAFGVELLRPLVDMQHSSVSGQDRLKKITSYLEKGENVIFFANHQIEADPQAISILLEKLNPNLGREMIFVAGERVLTDPLAMPFSMGRNLLCIYSKRYIDTPPELKSHKQMHNKRTMERMSELLSQGGKAIYVAPSGGRDRPNAQGVVEVAPFDSQSIEMFYLMSKKAHKPTHFFPLALATHDLLPPPADIQVELGERRTAKAGGIHLAFGPEVDMENFPGRELSDKHERRQARADYICNLVKQDYSRFPS